MLLTKPSLIPSTLIADAPSTMLPENVRIDAIREWEEEIVPKRLSGEEEHPALSLPNKIWNWTDTRGDRFAIAFAPTRGQAEKLARAHAVCHAAESVDLPTNKQARERALTRLRMRTRTPVVREITREEFETLCAEQLGKQYIPPEPNFLPEHIGPFVPVYLDPSTGEAFYEDAP